MMDIRTTFSGVVQGTWLVVYFVFLLFILLPVTVALFGIHGWLEKLNPSWAEATEPYIKAALDPFIEMNKYQTAIPDE